MNFTVVVDSRAILDIQEVIDYYDEQQSGLGAKFEGEINKHLLTLENNPHFQIRYDTVHCLPLKKFPFMIHFTLYESQSLVIVHAVFHTSLNPNEWKKR